MHGDDGETVPIAASALLSFKFLPQATLKVHENLPHGMATTDAETIDADLFNPVRHPIGRLTA